MFSFSGGGLAEQVVDVSAAGEVAVVDGWASVLELGSSTLQLVDLATGVRQAGTVDSAGNPVAADVAFPEPDGVWTVSPDYVLTRWEGNKLIDELFLGVTLDARAVIRGAPGRAAPGPAICTRRSAWLPTVSRSQRWWNSSEEPPGAVPRRRVRHRQPDPDTGTGACTSSTAQG